MDCSDWGDRTRQLVVSDIRTNFSVPRSEGFGAVLLKICEVLKGDRRVVAFLVLGNEWFRESIVNGRRLIVSQSKE